MFGLILLTLLAGPPAELRALRVLATADVQCRVRPAPDFEAPGEPRRRLGGWPGLERVIAQERTGGTLLIDCGGYAAGSAEAEATCGRAAVRFMNITGYDAATLGARDFNWGVNNLEMLARSAAFPLLADPFLDVVLRRQAPLFRPWVVRETAGLRVALVGLPDPGTASLNTRWNSGGFVPGWPAELLRRYLPAVSADTPDVIIVFGHFPAGEGACLLDSFPQLALVVCPGSDSEPASDRLLLVPPGGQRLAEADLLVELGTGKVRQVSRRAVNILPADSGSPSLGRLIDELGVAGEDSTGPWVPRELLPLAAAAALAEALRREAEVDVAVLPLEVVASGLAAGRPARHELRSVAPFDDRLRIVVLHDTLLNALSRSDGPGAVAPMVAGAELFVLAGTERPWPLVSELCRLRLGGGRYNRRVVTTERLLEASGIPDPGRPFEKTVTRAWLDYAFAADTIREVPLPRRLAAPLGMTPVAPLAPGLVNINTADAARLEELPGIGPKTAQRIIEYRTTVGSFRSPDDLGNVKGIGPKTVAKLRPLVTVR